MLDVINSEKTEFFKGQVSDRQKDCKRSYYPIDFLFLALAVYIGIKNKST